MVALSGLWDVLFCSPFLSPTGKKFRSKPQLARYLGNSMDLSSFDFRTGKMLMSKLNKNRQRPRYDNNSQSKVRGRGSAQASEKWICVVFENHLFIFIHLFMFQIYSSSVVKVASTVICIHLKKNFCSKINFGIFKMHCSSLLSQFSVFGLVLPAEDAID